MSALNRPPARFSALVHLAALSLVIAACGGDVVLPDRAGPAVQAEEARIAAVLEHTDDIWVPGECEVRLLGQDGDTSYAWAHCEGPDGESTHSGRSGPIRIDGERVSEPRDGSLYSEDIRRMFPPELVEVVSDGDERIYP